ncbi:hypothetical protein V9T40_014805 [Parthenolecanium corni]|uniref:Uncharacterized protein n=1 Tax=Parthenolecanium corni TaxID=536013 RepID=A0AAN9T2T5_9HEMI
MAASCVMFHSVGPRSEPWGHSRDSERVCPSQVTVWSQKYERRERCMWPGAGARISELKMLGERASFSLAKSGAACERRALSPLLRAGWPQLRPQPAAIAEKAACFRVSRSDREERLQCAPANVFEYVFAAWLLFVAVAAAAALPILGHAIVVEAVPACQPAEAPDSTFDPLDALEEVKLESKLLGQWTKFFVKNEFILIIRFYSIRYPATRETVKCLLPFSIFEESTILLNLGFLFNVYISTKPKLETPNLVGAQFRLLYPTSGEGTFSLATTTSSEFVFCEVVPVPFYVALFFILFFFVAT